MRMPKLPLASCSSVWPSSQWSKILFTILSQNLPCANLCLLLFIRLPCTSEKSLAASSLYLSISPEPSAESPFHLFLKTVKTLISQTHSSTMILHWTHLCLPGSVLCQEPRHGACIPRTVSVVLSRGAGFIPGPAAALMQVLPPVKGLSCFPGCTDAACQLLAHRAFSTEQLLASLSCWRVNASQSFGVLHEVLIRPFLVPAQIAPNSSGAIQPTDCSPQSRVSPWGMPLLTNHCWDVASLTL